MPLDIRIEQFNAPRPLAVVRRRAAQRDLSTVIPQACGEVFKLAKAQRPTGLGRLVAFYLDCTTDLLELEVGVELDSPIADSHGLFASELPAGRVATAVHMGPYQELHRAHVAIREWCKAQGHSLAGPNWEIYGHWIKAWESDPSQIRTDVYYLLK